MAEGSAAETRRSFYRPELDVLRFGAFVLVFIHHGFPLTAAEYAGWGVPGTLATLFASGARAAALSVDLFFALSAYLMTELLLREQRLRGSFDIRAFYMRRILRIWPLFYFALFVVLPLLELAMPEEKMPKEFRLAFLFFAGNWACAWWTLYPTSLALLWTVSIEEQFYAVWPWLLRLFGSRMPLCALGMLVVATLTRAFLIATYTGPIPNHISEARIWSNTLARLDPIACGALLALLLKGRIPKHTLRERVIWIAGGGLVLWIAGGMVKEPGWIWLVTYPVAAAGCVAIIYGSFAPDSSGPPGILAYLGKISYGLYVFHVAAIRLVQTLGPPIAGPIVLLIAFALTVTAAALSYRYLESPFLRWKGRFTHVRTRPV